MAPYTHVYESETVLSAESAAVAALSADGMLPSSLKA